VSEDTCLDALCVALSDDDGEMQVVARPDKEERNKKAVDAVLSNGVLTYSVEHTEVGSLSGQRAQSPKWLQLEGELRQRLERRLARGRWEFIPDVFEAPTTPANDFDHAVARFEQSLVEAADSIRCFRSPRTLECSTSRVEHPSWSGSLYRWDPHDHETSFSIANWLPDRTDIEVTIEDAVRRIKARKVPKLVADCELRGTQPILLLETTSVQVDHPFNIGNKVAAQIDEVELIILVATHNDEPYGVYDCRRGERIGP